MIELVVFDLAGTTVYDGDAVNASFRATLIPARRKAANAAAAPGTSRTAGSVA